MSSDEREPEEDAPTSDEREPDADALPDSAAHPIERVPHGPAAFALGVTLAVAVTFHLSFQPERAGSWVSFAGLGACYAVLGTIALLRLRARDELWLLRPRAGDLTVGALVAFLLYGVTFATHALLTAPGSPRHGWILRIYVLLGDPFSDTRHLVAGGVALVGVLEELTWRGLVTPMLERRHGELWAPLAASALFALAHLPTLELLADPVAGPNPLVVLAALGCGLVWSYLRWRTERLVPVLLSHGLFTWLIVEFPLFSS